MAKNKGDKAYKVEIAGSGVHRIDGIVREVSDAGVTIDVKERGRRTMRPTLIQIKDIIGHTAEGAGFVIVNSNHALEPISGTVVSEDESGITIQDVNGTEITFPSNGANGAQFVQVATDDRSLNRGAVETKVARLAERESGGGGGRSKKAKKASADGGEKKAKKAEKAGRRRRAK